MFKDFDIKGKTYSLNFTNLDVLYKVAKDMQLDKVLDVLNVENLTKFGIGESYICFFKHVMSKYAPESGFTTNESIISAFDTEELSKIVGRGLGVDEPVQEDLPSKKQSK